MIVDDILKMQLKGNNKNTICAVIDLLKSNPFYGCGENIEIAKGKNAIPRNWKQAKEQINRYRYWLNRK